MEQVGHLFIHRRHHLIGELQQGDIQLALVQRLHHLQPDETAPTTVTWRGLSCASAARMRSMSGMLRRVCTPGLSMPGREAGWGSARAQQQHVVGFAPLFAGQQVAHQQALAGPVYLDDVVKHPHIHVEPALEALRCLQQQGIPIRDIPPM
jgi:hypothetical protein